MQAGMQSVFRRVCTLWPALLLALPPLPALAHGAPPASSTPASSAPAALLSVEGLLQGRQGQEVVAQINGAPLYRLTLDLLTRVLQQEDPQFSREQVLERLINQRLLAQVARSRFAQYDLQATGKRVAFAPEVALEDQLCGYLRAAFLKQLEEQIKAMPGGSLQDMVLESGRLDAARLDPVLGTGGKLLLDYNFSPAQLEAAQKVMVLRSKLPGLAQISLFDVIKRQNVQGRVEIFNRNQDFIRQQAMQMLGNRFVLAWAEQQFGVATVADLRQSLQEQIEVRALYALHGVGSDMHADSPLLNKLAAQVSQQEVAAYYQAHKQEFKRIEWVKARHIQVESEEQARKVLDLLAKGGDFATLAQQYSRAPDAQRGGDLGKLLHQGKLGWLTELAFMQEEGKVSPPFRAAVGPHEKAYWEIVLVEKRQEGFQDVKSESVRYQAARALAQEKAVQQIQALNSQARKAARVEIRPLLAAGEKARVRS